MNISLSSISIKSNKEVIKFEEGPDGEIRKHKRNSYGFK